MAPLGFAPRRFVVVPARSQPLAARGGAMSPAALLLGALLAAPDGGVLPEEPAPLGETTVRSPSQAPGRATSAATRGELEERLPRSAPDALVYEPGVFVQQTAHGQGSAYLRGLTGQQTGLSFDGVRLNTSTWRQGPNQYFFTLDAQVLDSLEVQRGGSSTRFGSDALGGVVLAHPLEPTGVPGVRPSLRLRGASADLQWGGRVQVDAAAGPLSLVGGVGGRRVGLLRSGGPVRSALTGESAAVPRFAPDGVTQLGTGFDELSFDLRTVLRPAERHSVTLAGYGYVQLDAPRTDQCPPFAARFDECLTYDVQARALTLAAWEVRAPLPGVESVRVLLSWQRQLERRRNERPASFVREVGEDTVDTVGGSVVARFRPAAHVALEAGLDTWVDSVRSTSKLSFTDIGAEVARARGQYLTGSTSATGGVFLTAEGTWGRLIPRVGARLGWAQLRAPAEPSSGSLGVDASFAPVVGFAGVEWVLRPWLSAIATVDHSFRAPNLDDLTSRQQAGPGFQFENAALRPERSTSAELGWVARTQRVRLELWGFATLLTDSITRAPRDVADCPPNTPGCAASWARFSLTNAAAPSTLLGGELSTRVRPVPPLTLQGTVSFAWGEGPNVAPPPANPAVPYAARVPLSRVPPLNGTLEAAWRFPFGLRLGAAARWALSQNRLALADLSDARIPTGGTPGYFVVDLRAGVRLGKWLGLSVVGENLFDVAWRAHGSSVNGPGRGVSASLEWSPL